MRAGSLGAEAVLLRVEAGLDATLRPSAEVVVEGAGAVLAHEALAVAVSRGVLVQVDLLLLRVLRERL